MNQFIFEICGLKCASGLLWLCNLLFQAPLPVSHVKRMQQVYDFNAINNSEIRFRWLRLCIKSKWEEAIPLALKMATDQGRMKFTRPLFRDLYSFDKCRDLAVKTFLEHRASMHPVTSMLVGKDLKQDQWQTYWFLRDFLERRDWFHKLPICVLDYAIKCSAALVLI